MNINDLKMEDSKKLDTIIGAILSWKDITSVKYISNYLDKISIEKFGFVYNEFLLNYEIDVEKILESISYDYNSLDKNEVSFKDYSYKKQLDKIKSNNLKILILFEFIKNLLNDAYFLKHLDKEYSQNPTRKFRDIQVFEKKLDKIIDLLELTWVSDLYKSKEIFTLTSKGIESLLDLNNVQSDDISNIEWKKVILRYYEKTKITKNDHIEMLRIISPSAEKHKDLILKKNRSVGKELFKNLNNLDIRHDNSFEQIKSMFGIKNKDDYLILIKQTFELFLLAMILIDK